MIDSRNQIKFKGQDNQPQTVDRDQCEEREDVVRHREDTVQNYESPENYIKALDFTKVYKNGVAAVNCNTFSVKKGEVFGLLGPNGAGKSTMFNMMSMGLKRTSGDIGLLGNEIDKVSVVRDGNKMGMCA